MNFSKKQITIVGGIAIIVLLIVLAIIFGRAAPTNQKEITLTVWGVGDSEDVLRPIFESYQKSHSKTKIQYTEFNEADYQKSLINALAANNGPDIFMFHRSWLPANADKVLVFDKTKISLNKLRDLFPKAVEQDFSYGENIYALPLYIDTLATFYNKDILDNSAIAIPPKTWDEFKLLISKLRKLDPKTNSIIRAAGAIGGSNDSIHGASDIFTLMAMQEGVNFPKNSGERLAFGNKGQNALNFYLEFTNPKSLIYAWDDAFNYSLDAFANGQSAIIFDYQRTIDVLKKKNPYLNIGIAPMLQFNLDSKVNFADYWGLAVSKKSQNPSAAQDLILALTTNEAYAKAYLLSSGRPPALRSLINKYQDDPSLGVFAQQALSANSWYQVDSDFISQTFSDMIESALAKQVSIKDALEVAENKVNSLIQP